MGAPEAPSLGPGAGGWGARPSKLPRVGVTFLPLGPRSALRAGLGHGDRVYPAPGAAAWGLSTSCPPARTRSRCPPASIPQSGSCSASSVRPPRDPRSWTCPLPPGRASSAPPSRRARPDPGALRLRLAAQPVLEKPRGSLEEVPGGGPSLPQLPQGRQGQPGCGRALGPSGGQPWVLSRCGVVKCGQSLCPQGCGRCWPGSEP